MTFFVGQTVECIDDSQTNDWGAREIVKHHKYVVRWCGMATNPPYRRLPYEGVRLVGVRIDGGDYVPFAARRFRPIVENKTDISTFTAILDRESSKEKVPA